MITALTHVTVVVTDYDRAKEWYTKKLGLELRADNPYGEGFRWVTVGVPGQSVKIVLHKSHQQSPQKRSPRPRTTAHSLVFRTGNCRSDVETLRKRSVKITLEPQEVPWGIQAVFEDLDGNSHVFVQPPV